MSIGTTAQREPDLLYSQNLFTRWFNVGLVRVIDPPTGYTQLPKENVYPGCVIYWQHITRKMFRILVPVVAVALVLVVAVETVYHFARGLSFPGGSCSFQFHADQLQGPQRLLIVPPTSTPSCSSYNGRK